MSDSGEEILFTSNGVKYYIVKTIDQNRKLAAYPINTRKYIFGEFYQYLRNQGYKLQI